jgi:hypothetical protein
MGILSDLNKKRKEAQGKLKDEFLGFTSSASRKFVPKELRRILPFASAAVPFLLPGGFMLGGLNPALSRGIVSAFSNAAAQGLADPEAEDLNALSIALAGLTGAGAGQGVAGESAGETLRGMRGGPFTTDKTGILQSLKDAPIGADTLVKSIPDTRGFFGKARDLGLTGLAEATDVLGGARETMAGFGSDPGSLFKKAGAKELGKAIAVPAAQGTGDLAFTEATKALREFNATEEAELAQAGADEAAIAEARRNAIRFAMEVNDFTEDEIMETFNELGLKEGGIVSLAEGGMLNFGGREMDLRGGGFVPIGKKEKADDVPARLSKNEFVMTADAVRAAGGGSVNKGAQRMYDLMNNLEARA